MTAGYSLPGCASGAWIHPDDWADPIERLQIKIADTMGLGPALQSLPYADNHWAAWTATAPGDASWTVSYVPAPLRPVSGHTAPDPGTSDQQHS